MRQGMRNRAKRWRACTVALLLVVPAAAAADLEIPLATLDGWSSLAYSNIEPNRVTVEDGGLRIDVDASASPLIYRLARPRQITGATVRARWRGSLEIPDDATQGDKNADDFVLKLGLVESGEKTLSWLQRRIAADWIKELYRLAPEGSGVERILFLSTTQDESLVGSRRTHPLNDLLHERRIEYLELPGRFEMSQRFDEPMDVLGLWLSSDGDDTGSRFEVLIESITLHTVD